VTDQSRAAEEAAALAIDVQATQAEIVALRGALQEIADADAKTPVLTLNRIARNALERKQP
jgi:hypothetical protein